MQGPIGSSDGQGSGGAKDDRGEQGERGHSSVLADPLPIQLANLYGEKCALSSTMYQRIGRVS